MCIPSWMMGTLCAIATEVAGRTHPIRRTVYWASVVNGCRLVFYVNANHDSFRVYDKDDLANYTVIGAVMEATPLCTVCTRKIPIESRAARSGRKTVACIK